MSNHRKFVNSMREMVGLPPLTDAEMDALEKDEVIHPVPRRLDNKEGLVRDTDVEFKTNGDVVLKRSGEPIFQTTYMLGSNEEVNHPPHYGGSDNVYECIKVIEAWSLNFNLGNTLKYISRAEHKGAALDDLKKAVWYLNREIERCSHE